MRQDRCLCRVRRKVDWRRRSSHSGLVPCYGVEWNWLLNLVSTHMCRRHLAYSYSYTFNWRKLLNSWKCSSQTPRLVYRQFHFGQRDTSERRAGWRKRRKSNSPLILRKSPHYSSQRALLRTVPASDFRLRSASNGPLSFLLFTFFSSFFLIFRFIGK